MCQLIPEQQLLYALLLLIELKVLPTSTTLMIIILLNHARPGHYSDHNNGRKTMFLWVVYLLKNCPHKLPPEDIACTSPTFWPFLDRLTDGDSINLMVPQNYSPSISCKSRIKKNVTCCSCVRGAPCLATSQQWEALRCNPFVGCLYWYPYRLLLYALHLIGTTLQTVDRLWHGSDMTMETFLIPAIQ
jgi:hypothetical protein